MTTKNKKTTKKSIKKNKISLFSGFYSLKKGDLINSSQKGPASVSTTSDLINFYKNKRARICSYEEGTY